VFPASPSHAQTGGQPRGVGQVSDFRAGKTLDRSLACWRDGFASLPSADGDELDPEERAALEASLRRSWEQARTGQTRPADAILEELRTRS
jgi:hypothetical protein